MPKTARYGVPICGSFIFLTFISPPKVPGYIQRLRNSSAYLVWHKKKLLNSGTAKQYPYIFHILRVSLLYVAQVIRHAYKFHGSFSYIAPGHVLSSTLAGQKTRQQDRRVLVSFLGGGIVAKEAFVCWYFHILGTSWANLGLHTDRYTHLILAPSF